MEKILNREVKDASTVEKKFWAKVNKRNDDDCWSWSGSVLPGGYGILFYKDKKPQFRANRLAWFFAYGDIPEGIFVCHKCDNPNCVNPKHLFLGTPKDNTIDAVSKGRLNNYIHESGDKATRSKIKDNDVLAILASKEPVRNVMAKYGIAESTVSQIRSGKYPRIARILETGCNAG